MLYCYRSYWLLCSTHCDQIQNCQTFHGGAQHNEFGLPQRFGFVLYEYISCGRVTAIDKRLAGANANCARLLVWIVVLSIADRKMTQRGSVALCDSCGKSRLQMVVFISGKLQHKKNTSICVNIRFSSFTHTDDALSSYETIKRFLSEIVGFDSTTQHNCQTFLLCISDRWIIIVLYFKKKLLFLFLKCAKNTKSNSMNSKYWTVLNSLRYN